MRENNTNLFNYSAFLNNLKTSLNDVLTKNDNILSKEFEKLELICNCKKPDNNLLLSNELDQNLSENLTSIRKSILRKKKIKDEKNELQSKSVGKKFADSIKYAKVENKKVLKEIRICAEFRDLLKNSFESIVNSLVEELSNNNEGNNKNNNDSSFYRRKSVEFNITNLTSKSNNLSSRLSSVGSRKNLASSDFN